MTFSVSQSEWAYALSQLEKYRALHKETPPIGWKVPRHTAHQAGSSIPHSFIYFDIEGKTELVALDHQNKYFEKNRYLGSGFQAERVKLALNQAGEWFALKIMTFDELKSNKPPFFNLTEQKEAFQNEVMYLKKMGYGHGSAIRKTVYGQEKGYILQVYFDKGNLGDVLEEGRLTKETGLSLLMNLCKEFKRMKKKGICHSDLKLDNIMLKSHPSHPFLEAVMIDFGVATDRERLASTGYIRKIREMNQTVYDIESMEFNQLLTIVIGICDVAGLDEAFIEACMPKSDLQQLCFVEDGSLTLSDDIKKIIQKELKLDEGEAITPEHYLEIFDKLLNAHLDAFMAVVENKIPHCPTDNTEVHGLKYR